MLKRSIFICISILITIWGCTKKEVQPLDFKGDLVGKVTIYNEYRGLVNEKGNIKVSLDSSKTSPWEYTDTSGSFAFRNLSLGTYNITFSKEGYGLNIYQQLKFIGSDKPVSISTYLVQKSTTKINNYALAISGNTLGISGTISHKYPKSVMISYPYYWPGLTIYLSNSPNVSSTNYLSHININSDQNIDTVFNSSSGIYYATYPHGSTIYTIIYGRNNFGYSLYDLRSGTYYDPCLGSPSEVKSILIP